LSIVMTAFELNPKLFVVIRKNRRHNGRLFKQFNADITMQPTEIIAHECLAHMISPLLAQFLSLARSQTNDWANKLISQLVMTMGETVPETWAVRIDKENSPAVIELIKTGLHVTVQHLMQDPANRNDQLELVPILLLRNNVPSLVPDPSTRLKAGDRILFCGSPETKSTLPSILNNTKTLTYIIDGIEVPNSLVWRWLEKKFKRAN